MSQKALYWCLAELWDKAEVFKATGRTLILSTSSGVCKSDQIVLSELKAELKAGVNLYWQIHLLEKTPIAMQSP